MSDDRRSPARLRVIVAGPEPIVHELDPVPAGQSVGLRRLTESRGGPARYEAVVDGWRFEIEVESVARAVLRERASGAGRRGAGIGRQVVRAQIPGRIVAVGVHVGESVEAGQRLLSIEAMKMENAVIVPLAGTIAHIGVVAGQTVERGDELVVIE